MILDVLATLLAFVSGWACRGWWDRRTGRAVFPCSSCGCPCFPPRLCPSCSDLDDARRACAPKG